MLHIKFSPSCKRGIEKAEHQHTEGIGDMESANWTAGDWNEMSFKALSDPNQSETLWYDKW